MKKPWPKLHVFASSTALLIGMALAVPGTGWPACLDVPGGLIAWWPADGSGEDRVLDNDADLGVSTGFVAGEAGEAFVFNGTAGAAVMVPADPAIDVGTSDGFSIELWVNPVSNMAREPLVEWNRQTGTPNWGVHLWIATRNMDPNPHTGNVYANIMDTTGANHVMYSDDGFLVAGEFQHVALTYEKASGVATIYRNGVPIVSSDLGSFTPQTSYDLFFGSRPGPTQPTQYSGRLDEISLYNRALSIEDIQAIHEAGIFGKCIGRCADTNSDRFVKASDALFVLRTSVGTESCALCTCDVNGSNSVSASDALLALRIAVGVGDQTACPACSDS